MSTRTAAAVTSVAPGVFRVGVAEVNCYLVVATDGITLVDAGLPGSYPALAAALGEIGAGAGDIDALLLTHGHFDHVGMARRLRGDGAPRPLAHPLDRRLVRHPYRYRHERARLLYPLRYPRSIPTLAAMTAAGALTVRGVDAEPRLQHGQTAAVPGRPTVLWTPGHTEGHCGFHFPEHGVLLTGDALVTLDPYTGARGPRIVAGAATADSGLARDSLDVFRGAGDALLLPGHGEPWAEGADAAIATARASRRA